MEGVSQHDINTYINTIKKFIYYKTNPTKDVYTIRYEDLFDNNFKNLKDIFDSIGLKYNEKIFDNSNYSNQIYENIPSDIKNPTDKQHFVGTTHGFGGPKFCEYRTWQINQPFINNNDKSKLDLTDEQKNILLTNDNILNIYPNIKSEI